MRIIKDTTRHQLGQRKQALSAIFPQNGFRLFILILLFHFVPSVFLIQGGTLVWAQGFETLPQVIDDGDEDSIFSPNGDGIQDNLLISFVTDGSLGNFRVTIDVHGPGGVGLPDGAFDSDDDWVVEGNIGPGLTVNDAPKIIRHEWDGRDRSPGQQAPPTPRTLADGTYHVRVEIDAFQNNAVNIGELGYTSTTHSATIDTKSPQLSAQVARRDFSPNSDIVRDTTAIVYNLDEDLVSLELEFTDLTNQPAISLTAFTLGSHTFNWNGKDGLGTSLNDGVYTLQLRGSDKGGNVGTFEMSTIRIDTELPTISQVTPSQNVFPSTPVEQIEAVFSAGEGSPIDFSTAFTQISLKKDGTAISGVLSNEQSANRVTLTLDQPLDASDENGVYTISVAGGDKAGNTIQGDLRFTFDTVAPTVTTVTSDGGNLTPGIATNAQITFVEASLEDNISAGLNFSGSTIRLSGPNGAVSGAQRRLGESVRWTLGFPLTIDGSDDGVYTISVQPLDLAGNAGGESQIPFIYDTQVPELVSLTSETGVQLNAPAGAKTFLNSSLSLVTAAFNDENGSGIDFSTTRIEMIKVASVDGEDLSIGGMTTTNADNNTLEFRLTNPISIRDGSQDGIYRVQVTFVDKAGNAETENFDLMYSTQVAAIISTSPSADATVSALSQVSVVLNDAISVDFSATAVRLTRAGAEVSTAVSNNGKDTITLTLSQPLAIDGSEDGEYSIEITSVDRAGNTGPTVRRRFFVASREPEIRLNTPTETRINALTMVEAQLLDYIGPGIDFSASTSTITVRDANGVVVNSKSVIADEENVRLIWAIDTLLSRDGSVDGDYTASVTYTDLVGRQFTANFVLPFDTQVPTIASTAPAASERIVPNLDQISVKFEADFSGVDMAVTQVRLLAPSGNPVGLNRSNNGVDTITLRFNPLQTDGTADGVYTIEVTSADRAGNVAESPIQVRFTYTARESRVDLLSPSTIVINQLNEITAVIQNYVGPGIDFDVASTVVSVTDAAGNTITAKSIENNGTNQITWTIAASLPRDGSADGVYTVDVGFVDKAGAIFSQTFVLTFDTLTPTITSTTPAAGARISALNSVTVTLADNLSGVDVDNTAVRLVAPSSTAVPSTISSNGERRIFLSFYPLKIDGIADGVYGIEVTPIDLAGNTGSLSVIEFTYATQVPEIDTLVPADNATVNRVQEIRAVLIDSSGEGLDFDQSTIYLTNIAGEMIPGVLGNDGGVTLTLAVVLPTNGTADGRYTADLHLVDKFGAAADYTRRFTYDSRPPVITDGSRPLAENTIVTDRVEVEFEVTDGAGAGVDFAASTIVLFDESNINVDSAQADDGVSKIVFRSDALPSIGVYTLIVTLADRAGNSGIPQQFTYTYDAEEPVIESVTHVDFTANISNVSDLLTRIEVTLSDIGSGIDFDLSLVQLLNASGEVVPGFLNHDDEARIWWQLDAPLSRSGNADGLYTIEVITVDEAGNIDRGTFRIRYDTQVPTAGSIVATQTDGTTIALLSGPTTLITFPIQQITVAFSDREGSGVDLSQTMVRLIDPSGAQVGANQSDNGTDTVFLSFNALRADGSDDGLYRIQVTPTDLAGNTFTSPVEFQFFYGTRKPEIVSTTPAGFSFATQFTVVSVTLQDHSGEGIDFGRSAIRLCDPAGNAIAGRQRADETTATMTWELDAPPSRDGQGDGEYLLQLTVFDKAGNLLDEVKPFVYDTLIPQIASVTASTDPLTPVPAEALAIINQSFTEISLQLSDANDETTAVSGVDLAGTTVRLLAPGGAEIGINTRDDGLDTITISFAQLRQLGTYTLEITPRDVAGNVSGHAIAHKFSLDFERPGVSSVEIGEATTPVEFVNQLDEIVATLVDTSSAGLDLTVDGSTITVIGPNGEVDGIQSSRNQNQIVWTPLQLATDGSADGIYSVTVAPVDSAGRPGTLARYQITLDTQEPEVMFVTPINLTQPVSYIGQQITQIAAQVADVGPAGLEISAQGLQLRDAGDNVVAADQTDDGNTQIFLTLLQRLATDGSDDGTYTVILDLVDKAGNLNAIAHKLVYDTQAPTLVSTDPDDGSLRSDDIILITVNLNDLGASGIDFVASQLTLLDPGGNPINGTQNNDGRGRLTLQINGLAADGNYTIRTQATDRAGNGANAPFEALFTFSSSIPDVVSTVPQTTPAEQAFTNESFRQVEVELQSDDGGSNRSTITLLSPDGTTVPGQQMRNGNKLIYRLLRELASDGSDDGIYTISVTPTNSAGRQGEPRTFTFVYDTVPPEADLETLALIVAEPGVNNALNEIQMTITDDQLGSGIDWENLDDSWFTLEQIGTSREIRGSLSTDNQQIEASRASGTLTFRLTTPLASDGSQDGEYRVTIAPKDRAGGVSELLVYEFFYDTRPPVIDTTALLINEQPLIVDTNDPDFPSPASGGSGVVIRATLRDTSPDGSGGLGVDLAKSSITVRAPDGSVISGNLTQNGTDGITFKSGPLGEQGLYQVTVTSVGLDEANLGFQPSDSISTQFLYETTKPIATLADFGGETLLEDEPLPLRGTAHDPVEDDIPASEVTLVEIVGTGPDGELIDPVVAEDESEAEEEPWNRWSLDFLPARSGEYNLDIRVTDRAGNVGVYDAVTVDFSVSLTFKGPTYCWPNPLRKSIGDIGHFSFEVNVPGEKGAEITLRIYDFAGDLVYEEVFGDIGTGRDSGQIVTWDLKNKNRADVARGVYIFRLEAEDTATSNRTNAVGKILVVE